MKSENIYVVFTQTFTGINKEKVLATSKTDALDTFNSYYQSIEHVIIKIIHYNELIGITNQLNEMGLSSKVNIFSDEIPLPEIKIDSPDYESFGGAVVKDLVGVFLELLEDINLNADDFLISEKIRL